MSKDRGRSLGKVEPALKLGFNWLESFDKTDRFNVGMLESFEYREGAVGSDEMTFVTMRLTANSMTFGHGCHL